MHVLGMRYRMKEVWEEIILGLKYDPEFRQYFKAVMFMMIAFILLFLACLSMFPTK